MTKKTSKKSGGKVQFYANPILLSYLQQLVAMGIFGSSVGEVAERFVCKELQRLLDEKQPWLKPYSKEK